MSEQSVTTHQRIVLCLDGTWANTYRRGKAERGGRRRAAERELSVAPDGPSTPTEQLREHTRERRAEGKIKPSNPLKMSRAVPAIDATGMRQVVHYDRGVGSLGRYPGAANWLLAAWDRAIGGYAGAGFEEQVADAVRFLADNYLPGDEVFIFGFSRGASAARAVTHVLDWIGGVPDKRDVYYLPHLFNAYLKVRGAGDATQTIAAINARRPNRPPLKIVPVPVTMLGVYDTVLSLGGRFRLAGRRTTGGRSAFLVPDTPAACVDHAVQALAIDEQRLDFRAEVWQRPSRPGQQLEQAWFAGRHSNVGGGMPHDGLANIPLHWMVNHAEALGLRFDPAFLRYYRPLPTAEMGRPPSRFNVLLDVLRLGASKRRRRLVGQPETANLTVHRTVLVRYSRPACEYAPENLLAYLAEHPELRVPRPATRRRRGATTAPQEPAER